jgi:hypothetical protein
MNKLERKRRTDATVCVLEALIVTEGRPVYGGTQVIIPAAIVRNIKALAYDVIQPVARDADLNQTQVTA